MAAALRWWSWAVNWVVANLEASERLVIELRQEKEQQERYRMQVEGLTEEELLLLDLVFSAWLVQHTDMMTRMQRTTRRSAQQSSALLLLCLDIWTESALAPRRADNLRRRRHVRFDIA
eukprot:CAMPEP_0176118448 /NCGR_PEP_ID=MMETSP0120_2-20121206/59528_1 /TAXON_ID=160619 /ORGANISM="Kryptoperidinium foliaceum, Strain CCMP 1326" /LENGTH=118 /DNA_ID=CAMNT_0017452789 /DNA_START=6 /DNA_END=358 /DNA_ORIENTATION=+